MDHSIPFVNETFELYAIEKWQQYHRTTRAKSWKGPSVGFIVAFKRAWGFDTKRPRVEHIAKNPNVNEQLIFYREECMKWMKHVGPALFLNYDETYWRLLLNVLQSWGRRGQQLRLKTTANNKAGMTIGMCVAARGEKLPLQLISRGKAGLCLKKFQLQRFKGKVAATH